MPKPIPGCLFATIKVFLEAKKMSVGLACWTRFPEESTYQPWGTFMYTGTSNSACGKEQRCNQPAVFEDLERWRDIALIK
jgi:hypothetical protein